MNVIVSSPEKRSENTRRPFFERNQEATDHTMQKVSVGGTTRKVSESVMSSGSETPGTRKRKDYLFFAYAGN